MTVSTPRKPCTYSADRVLCQNSLHYLIKEAYQVKDLELVSPRELNDDVFALNATMPQGTSRDVARLMLQQALAERFGLRAHREARELRIYALVLGKQGTKLQAAEDAEHRQLKSVDSPTGSLKSFSYSRPGELFLAAVTLDDLAASILPNQVDLDLPVVNKTGLTGEYKFDMHWVPSEQAGPVRTLKDPAFLAALDRQYGLRLEKSKAVYSVLIVDHMDRMPTAN